MFIVFLDAIKMEQRVLNFGKECLNKNAFHDEKPISTDKVEIRKIVLPKIDSYGSFKINRINTNSHGNKMPEDNECCTFLSVILLDSVVKIDNYYYHLEGCKYAVKKKKIINCINEELNVDESYNDESDNDRSIKSNED